MLGFALSVLHISYNDFCVLTPTEFNQTCKAYNEVETARMQDNWERMRLLATISVQPHTKRKLTPQKLLPFAWDGRKKLDKKPIKGDKERARRAFEKFGETYK